MKNSLNRNMFNKPVKASVKKNKVDDVNKNNNSNNNIVVDNQVEVGVEDKKVNLMARRYELAYIKLHDELPSWKKRAFNKNNKNVNDTLYNEFIATVIAFAENEQNNV